MIPTATRAPAAPGSRALMRMLGAAALPAKLRLARPGATETAMRLPRSPGSAAVMLISVSAPATSPPRAGCAALSWNATRSASCAGRSVIRSGSSATTSMLSRLIVAKKSVSRVASNTRLSNRSIAVPRCEISNDRRRTVRPSDVRVRTMRAAKSLPHGPTARARSTATAWLSSSRMVSSAGVPESGSTGEMNTCDTPLANASITSGKLRRVAGPKRSSSSGAVVTPPSSELDGMRSTIPTAPRIPERDGSGGGTSKRVST